MTLTLRLAGGGEHARAFTVPSPTAQVEVLFRIVHTHLEGLKLEQCPVGMALRLEATLPERQQFQLFESPLRDPNRFGETLGRLAALVGAENVGVPSVLDTHRPDRFRLEKPRFHELGRTAPLGEDLAVGLPLRRFRPALAATVQVVRGRPTFLFSEAGNGPVRAALGPYRASGAWWDREAWAVEEWDVELENGGLYRLACVGQAWCVEGSYAEPAAAMTSAVARGRIVAMPGVSVQYSVSSIQSPHGAVPTSGDPFGGPPLSDQEH
jgi:protein ImuB